MVWGVVVVSLALIGACSASDGVGPGGNNGNPSAVDSIVLSLDSAEVIVGDTVRLRAVPRDSTGAPLTGISLTWTTSDPAVATVSSEGLVTSNDMGDVDIDVSVAAAATSRTAAARVSARSSGGGGHSRVQLHSVPRIVITPATRNTDVGGKVQYSASITDATGHSLRRTPTVRWSSSATAVATIDIAGLATAIKKGTTSIRATVTTSTSYDYVSPAARLDVGVCGGLLDVATWEATSLSSNYVQPEHVAGFDFTLDFTVSEGSLGTAHLVRTSGSSSGDTAVWEGQVTGTARMDNKVVQTFRNGSTSTTTEVANGAQGAAFVRLYAEYTARDGCQVSIRYVDVVRYQHTETGDHPNNFSAVSPVGVSVDRLHPVGDKPSAGWKIEATASLTAALFPNGGDDQGDDLVGLGIRQYYVPITSVAAAVLLYAPNYTLGHATFAYSLTAH